MKLNFTYKWLTHPITIEKTIANEDWRITNFTANFIFISRQIAKSVIRQGRKRLQDILR